MTTNGLDALQRQRERGSRTVLPPRHAPKPLAPSSAAPDKAETTPVAPPAPTPPQVRSTDSSAQTAYSAPSARPATPAPAPAADDTLVRCSIYVDTRADNYLEEIRGSGRRGQPKIDANRSAVVRLALERMQSELDPAQVVAILSERAQSATSTGGRKRI